MALPNARIDELPLGTPKQFDVYAFRDVTEGITKKAYVPVTSGTGNYDWVTDNDPGYATGNIVTYGGLLWRSKVDDNLNIVPGSDPTKWEQIGQSQSGAYWQAGVYLEDKVTVFYRILGILHEFELNESEDRPFNSANFLTELEAGQWIQIGANVFTEVDTTGADIEVDFNQLREGLFIGSDDIAGDKGFSFVNDGNAVELKAFFITFASLQTLTMAANIKMGDARFDSGSSEWTPFDVGTYKVTGHYVAAIDTWFLNIGMEVYN